MDINKIKEEVALMNGYEPEILGTAWDFAMQLTYRTKDQIRLYEDVIKAVAEAKNESSGLHLQNVRLSLPPDFWQKLREQYFLSCTNKIDVQISKTPPKVNMAAHDLFEWFKNKILGKEA